jgi:hypothetical protein
MKINLEIISSAYLINKQSIENLNTKEFVPKMVFRRRLTQASKLVIELMNCVDFKQGRIMYGSAYGELESTSNILQAILNESGVSPTDFQNSVYNTAASYASILYENQNEIMTISSGDNTGEKLLKLGAIKALDGDEILLVATETMNIKNIQEINHCIDYLECAVALKVRVTQNQSTLVIGQPTQETMLPPSMALLIDIAKRVHENQPNILSVAL